MTEDTRTPGQIANDNTDAAIASWHRNRRERRNVFAIWILTAFVSALCFAYAWTVYPY